MCRLAYNFFEDIADCTWIFVLPMVIKMELVKHISRKHVAGSRLAAELRIAIAVSVFRIAAKDNERLAADHFACGIQIWAKDEGGSVFARSSDSGFLCLQMLVLRRLSGCIRSLC
ncbi:hypothetical protein U1Q18_024725 [Sarracenia purpurea var. burkii]